MLPVRLPQNNSSQKAISTFATQKSQISWKNNTKISFSTSDTTFAETTKLKNTLTDACICYILFDFFCLSFYFKRAADQAKAGDIVHGKVIIAAGTEMAQRWADHPPAMLPVAATRPLTQAHGLIWSQRRGQWLLPDLKEVSGAVSVKGSKVRQKRPLPTFLLCNSKG